VVTSETDMSASLENYLKIILDLEKINKVVKTKHIAEKLVPPPLRIENIKVAHT